MSAPAEELEEETRITFELSDETAQFRVNVEQRTIAGHIVPWDVAAFDSKGISKWRFRRGSLHWPEPSRVKLNLYHDPDRVVAYAQHLQETPIGLYAKFKVARGEEGDRALSLAEDKVLDGFSIEPSFEQGGWEFDAGDRSIRNVARARLVMTALVPVGAFEDARVESIAAAHQEGLSMETESKETQGVNPEEEEGAAKFEQHLTTLADKLAASQKAAGEELTQNLSESITAGFRTALENIGDPQGPSTVRAARFSTLKEAPVYRFDGSGESLVRDAWLSARDHDEDATERIRKFRRQSQDMAELVSSMLHFAPQTTSTASQIIPPGYRPDLYVSDLFRERPYVNAASQGSISNATPFTVPVFTSVTTGSATHVEGTNPSDGSLAFGTKTVTPQAISGRIVLSRELVDSANPAIDQIAFAEMRESYARQTEAIVYTLLNGTSGSGGTITAGFVPSGAQAVTTAGGTDNQTLVKAIRKAIADYWFARFAAPTTALMGQGATARLAQAVDTTQRPLFPWTDGMNSPGAADAFAGGYQVDSLRFTPAWVNTGVAAGDSQIHILNRSDLWVWESPLLTFRFEEKQGPANIELNIFGYFATHLLRPVGLSGIRIT